MSLVPLSLFCSQFKIGGIYRFINDKIDSDEPHPHICISIENDEVVLLLCGTSQWETKLKHFEYSNTNPITLVRVKPSEENDLTKDTYLNCNEPQEHSISGLYQSFNSIAFKTQGGISESELLQIATAIKASRLIDDETKELILAKFPDFGIY